MADIKVTGERYTVDPVYQWDKNHVLKIYGLSLTDIPEIHYANSGMDKAIVRQATMDNAGVVRVDVPNTLLQTAGKMKVYICGYSGTDIKTLYTLEVPVKARTKPSDYVFEDTAGEVYSFKALENKVENALYKMSTDHERIDAELNSKYETAEKKYKEAVGKCENADMKLTRAIDILGELTESGNIDDIVFGNTTTYLLTADSDINKLINTGRYYYVGDNPTIRSLLSNAGLEIDVPLFATHLFIDVVDKYGDGDPGSPVGQVTQHVTVRFIEDKTSNAYIFEYDRVHNMVGSGIEYGNSWNNWIYATHNIYTVRNEIMDIQGRKTVYITAPSHLEKYNNSLDNMKEPGTYYIYTGACGLNELYPDLFVIDGLSAYLAVLKVETYDNNGTDALCQELTSYFNTDDTYSTYKTVHAVRLDIEGDPPMKRWRISKDDFIPEIKHFDVDMEVSGNTKAFIPMMRKLSTKPEDLVSEDQIVSAVVIGNVNATICAPRICQNEYDNNFYLYVPSMADTEEDTFAPFKVRIGYKPN